jgi:hypothetical protein
MSHPQYNPELSITVPSAAEAVAIERDGFVVLPGLIDPAWRVALAERLDALSAAEGDRAGLEVHQEAGTSRLANLVDKGAVFDPLWTHPRVLGLVRHVLGRAFSLSSLNAREPKPGEGHQALHADWRDRQPEEPFHVVNSLWALDGMDADNGATRLVPGSHLISGPIPDPHPAQMLATLNPGDVVVLNAHCRHGGTVNRSGRRRRVIHGYFTAAEHPQQCDFPKLVSAETRARLTAAQRALLRC